MVLLLSWKKEKKMLKKMFLISENTFKIIILCFPKAIHFKALKVLFFDNFLAFFMMKTSCKCLKTNFFASKKNICKIRGLGPAGKKCCFLTDGTVPSPNPFKGCTWGVKPVFVARFQSNFFCNETAVT